MTAEEKKRRGRYQVEHAGKLPWGVPGLDESVPNVEVDVRSSREQAKSSPTVSPQPTVDQEVTLDDLDELQTSLLEIERALTPEDMPEDNLPHPVKDALSLLAKQRKQIIGLRDEFERLSAKLEDRSTPPSAVTSVDISNTDGSEQLRVLEERKQELERELQNERTAREQEVNALQVKNAKLEKAKELLQKEKEEQASAAKKIAEEVQVVKEAEAAGKATAVRLREELEVAEKKARGANEQAERLTRGVEEARSARNTLEEELGALRRNFDQLSQQKDELVGILGERERSLRDAKSEAELDRATLEKELADEKERSSNRAKEFESKLSEAEEKISEMKTDRDGEFAELQVMCNERGKALEDSAKEKEATHASLRTLLNLFRLFFDAYTSHLKSLIDDPIPLVVTSSSPSKENSSLSSPSAYNVPVFQATNLSTAIASMKALDSSLIELARKKMDLCALQTKKWMKECKRYKERATRAVDAAKEKLAFRRWVGNKSSVLDH